MVGRGSVRPTLLVVVGLACPQTFCTTARSLPASSMACVPIARLEMWWDRHRGEAVLARDLVEIASKAGIDLGAVGEGDIDPRGARLGTLLRGVRLGSLLRKRRDRIIGGYKLTADPTLLHGTRHWRLVRKAPAAG